MNMPLNKQLYLPNVVSFHANKNGHKIEGDNLAKLFSFKVKGFRNITKVPQVWYTLQKKSAPNAKIISKPNANTTIVSESKSKVPLVKKVPSDKCLKIARKSRIKISAD